MGSGASALGFYLYFRPADGLIQPDVAFIRHLGYCAPEPPAPERALGTQLAWRFHGEAVTEGGQPAPTSWSRRASLLGCRRDAGVCLQGALVGGCRGLFCHHVAVVLPEVLTPALPPTPAMWHQRHN